MNTDAAFAELGPPVYDDGRRRVVGRYLSEDQHHTWSARLRDVEYADAAAAWQWPRAVRAFCDAVFPRPWCRPRPLPWVAEWVLARPAAEQVTTVLGLLTLPSALQEQRVAVDDADEGEGEGEGASGARVPHLVLVGRFVARYGYAAYRNALYPTTDHIIPAPWFAAHLGAMPHLDAGDDLRGAMGVALGAAVALGGKDSKAPRLVRRLDDVAHPKVYDELPEVTDGA